MNTTNEQAELDANVLPPAFRPRKAPWGSRKMVPHGDMKVAVDGAYAMGYNAALQATCAAEWRSRALIAEQRSEELERALDEALYEWQLTDQSAHAAKTRLGILANLSKRGKGQ